MVTRQERHEVVKALKATGLTFEQIATQLGIAKSTATAAYYDPTGEKDRIRKQRRFGYCIGCGIKTFNSGGEPPKRCIDCRHEYMRTDMAHRHAAIAHGQANRHITKEQIIAAIHALGEDGPITANRYKAVGPERGYPSMALIYLRFETWADACAAAGVVVPRKGPYANRITVDQCLSAVRACADHHGHPPTYREYEAWARQTGNPSGGVVRKRFGGSFMDAVDTALALEMAA